MSDKVVLVTGASGDIGGNICNYLSENGYFVLGLYNKNIPSCESKLTDKFQVDLLDQNKVKKLIDEINKKYAIYGLVNCAGITIDQSFKKMSYQQWSAVMDTNIAAIFSVTQPIYIKMLERNYGRIVNISSIIGLTGNYGQSNYSASKAAIIGFTKSLALEGASRNVNVNCIAPGFIHSKMVDKIPERVLDNAVSRIPMKRAGSPADVSRAVGFFMGEDSCYITGETLNINGGLLMA